MEITGDLWGMIGIFPIYLHIKAEKCVYSPNFMKNGAIDFIFGHKQYINFLKIW